MAGGTFCHGCVCTAWNLDWLLGDGCVLLWSGANEEGYQSTSFLPRLSVSCASPCNEDIDTLYWSAKAPSQCPVQVRQRHTRRIVLLISWQYDSVSTAGEQGRNFAFFQNTYFTFRLDVVYWTPKICTMNGHFQFYYSPESVFCKSSDAFTELVLAFVGPFLDLRG